MDTPLQIGEWRVDPSLDQIRRGEKTVKLEPRAMRVLVCLAEHAGQVVTVDELLDTVWKDVVVTPDSVYQAVASLRKALGDDTKEPVYIANVVRRGYRMVAAVRPLADQAQIRTPGPGADANSDPTFSRPSGPPARGGVLLGRRFDQVTVGVLAVVFAYVVVDRFWIFKHSIVVQPPAASRGAATVTPVAFNPPPHSIAVLPFVNISGDANQQYFSDGLTEEVLNSLTQINQLQVAARTSSFSFQGPHPDIGTVAHKLNVASVLEGSVRRSGRTIRVTVQLNNAVTGFHLWSQSYDRDLGDVLKLQTEIATAVANALKVRLLGDEAARIERGGTRDPAAFDAYLRGSKSLYSGQGASSNQSAIAAYTEAIRLDPNYALAFAGRSQALSGYAWEFATGMAVREFFDKSKADAQQALDLAPELAEGHLALGAYFQRGSHDFAAASEAFERAMALAPGNAVVLGEGGRFAAEIGRFDAGIAAARRAVALDPLSAQSRALLGDALYAARRYEEAVVTYGEVLSLEPDYKAAYGFRGLAYYGLGDFRSARSSCETKPDYWASQRCLAVTYDKQGRHADAEAELKKYQAAYGNAAAYSYAAIYTQWGDKAKALEWLATAMRVPCGCLVHVKTDPLLDPLRKEPRFQAIERELKFPD
jgi:TolB-like protein/DNA-binding winged helix-turn-helix (wHTH) protein/Tfp pilus assembly protein PilF